ncbi:hypothetical protein LRS10_17270 [Phenylobacterium sp. J426]|uniref:hypothetical protein n=1 Tax=Phenylobacterium sp. J426 TaxID=2898439 RepID=UPI00215143B5|nr:hypothetical protein [Phenylobacterium sp. J426]MCR5875761.1 hypothetical protein [Phenylobacterium sp. J426]
MVRRTLLTAALIAFAPAAAIAAGKTEAPPKDAGQYVELLPVALPIVADGRLVNYVFVYVRINLAPTANPTPLRAKEPQFRDALVRAGHRTPFTLAADHNKIDTAKLIAAVMREGAGIAGPGQIKSVVVTSQQPRRRVATPRL